MSPPHWAPMYRPWVLMKTKVPGSRTGSDRRRTCSKIVKMPVFAPMPSASVSTATPANPGLLPRLRSPYRMSCQIVTIIQPPFAIRSHRFQLATCLIFPSSRL